MIELSNNEAASLVKLAARGVGYPWGLVEEAAHVSRWLIERRIPTLELFRSLFTWVDEREFSQLILQPNDNRWRCSRDELCPLVCGAAIIDSASMLLTEDKIELNNVVCPILLIPFISEASVLLEKSIRMTWKDAEFVVNGVFIESINDSSKVIHTPMALKSPASICITVVSDPSDIPEVLADSEGALLKASSSELWPVVLHSRVSVDLICLESLKQYAHRTYAPATEQSRLSGAGAGTSDND
ncbi:MAG: hypothetical protein ACI9XK_004812 [Granulosicoccus sp.]|jgi:hypothetical protein